jgi:hypothetical protein
MENFGASSLKRPHSIADTQKKVILILDRFDESAFFSTKKSQRNFIRVLWSEANPTTFEFTATTPAL